MTFDEFVAARLPALLRYAVVLTGDAHLAQDVAQEVMARAFVRWGRIEATGAPEPYVRRMLVNEYLSWRRSWAARHLQASGEKLTGIADARVHGGDPADGVGDADEVWALLATLPRRQRAVVVLRYYEGLDDREISTVLGCSPATVRSHASKALHALRLDTLRPQAPGEPPGLPAAAAPSARPASHDPLYPRYAEEMP